MEEKKKGIISEPDENGIRYYTFGQSEGRSPLPPSQEDRDEKKEAFAGAIGRNRSSSWDVFFWR